MFSQFCKVFSLTHVRDLVVRYASLASCVCDGCERVALARLKLAGLSKAPDYLKLDAEGFEWTFLPSLLASPEELLPKQIALEVHLWTLSLRERMQRGGFTPIPFRNASATVSEVASFVNPLWAKGYRLQSIDYNNPRRIPNPCGAELLLVRE